MKQYRSLFRNRNFLMLWMGHAISNIGDFFNALALVKVLSEDPAHLGFWISLIMIAKVVPGVVLGPVAGVVADRLPRKAVLIVTDLLRAGLVLGLVFVTGPAEIIGLVALSACVSAFFNPASSAMLPNLVAQDELVSAGSLQVMTSRTAQLIGNGIGAVVLLYMGPHKVFYIDAVSFIVSALFTLGIAGAPAAVAAVERTGGIVRKMGGDLKEALAFIKGTPVIRHLLIALGIACVGDSALNVLLTTFFTNDLGLPAEKLGFVFAVFGGASVVGALVIGAIGNRVHWRHLLVLGAVHVWLTISAAILIHQPLASAGMFAVMGLGSGAVNVAIQAAIGVLVPDQVRGRVFSFWGMLQSLIYVGGVLAAGALSDRFSPGAVMLAFTVSYLLTGAYAYFAFRSAPSQPAGATVAAD